MTILKCKMCGGDIIVNAEQTYGTCDSCGSTMTLPRVDSDQRANMFNRANHFRRLNDFDKAVAAYESILNADDSDAEAHWGVVLSRYGIEYVEDPATHERIPTCHRVQYESILADADYQAALVNAADTYTRDLYENEAARIAEIQKNILAISSSEKPYDVFICYKETSEAGTRTKDSTIAQDIYYQLTQEGYKVFFSRISLEDKLGTAYEPYIFAALNSAKVMAVVGTSTANFNAVWVKNEWSRFLALMKKDRSRLLIPCYRDIDPYDLPEELSMLQSQDMGKIGFIQDLVRGIKKVVDAGRAKSAPVQAAPAAQEASVAPGVQSLLKRANIFLEDGDFAHADEYFERVLDADPECADAYWGKMLASLHLKSDDEVTPYYIALFDKILESMPEVNAHTLVELTEEQAAKIEYLKGRGFASNSDFTYLNHTSKAEYLDKSQMARDAQEQYENEFSINKNPFYIKALRFVREGDKKRYAVIKSKVDEHIQSRILECDEIVRISIEKANHVRSQATDSEIEKTARAIEDRKLVAQKKEAERMAAEKARVDKERKRKKTTRAVLIATIILTVLTVSAIYLMRYIRLNNAYNQAVALMEAGDYDAAVAAFAELEEYRDAREHVLEIKYAQAEAFLAASDYGRAALIFDALGDYRDAKDRSHALWDGIANHETVSAGIFHTVGLKSDGTVVAVGANDYGQCDVSGWTDIVAVSAASHYTVGLMSDGTVVAVGGNRYVQRDVFDWRGIKVPEK